MAESTIIDTVVVLIIIGGGLGILYKALKEPLDAFFGLIRRALGSIKDKVVDMGDSAGSSYEEITYG